MNSDRKCVRHSQTYVAQILDAMKWVYPSHNGHNYGDGYNSSNGAKISRGLDAPAELSGLVRLLQDATSVRRELAEVLAGAFLAVRSQNMRSYRGIFDHGQT